MADRKNTEKINGRNADSLSDDILSGDIYSLFMDDEQARAWEKDLQSSGRNEDADSFGAEWDTNGFGDMSDPFGLKKPVAGFGDSPDQYMSQDAGPAGGHPVPDAGVPGRQFDQYLSNGQDTDITDEHTLIREFIDADISVDRPLNRVEDTLIAADAAISEDASVSEIRDSDIAVDRLPSWAGVSAITEAQSIAEAEPVSEAESITADERVADTWVIASDETVSEAEAISADAAVTEAQAISEDEAISAAGEIAEAQAITEKSVIAEDGDVTEVQDSDIAEDQPVFEEADPSAEVYNLTGIQRNTPHMSEKKTDTEGGKPLKPKKARKKSGMGFILVLFVIYLLTQLMAGSQDRNEYTQDYNSNNEYMTEQDIDNEDFTEQEGLFTKARVRTADGDYTAVIDVSDIESIWYSSQYNEDRVSFLSDNESIYLNAYSTKSIESDDDFEDFANLDTLKKTYAEVTEKYKGQFVWNLCDVYCFSYETKDTPDSETVTVCHILIDPPDGTEFYLTIYLFDNSIAEDFDPESFLDNHLTIEES